MIVVLAGGTGAAKLAAGLYELVGERLTVVANTGDDVEVYGVHVSPDPDLIAYWLAGSIDERGWGIRGDSFEVMGALEAAGHPTWFRLGDRDLASCLIRTERLRAGARLTEAHAELVSSLGIRARVLPMSDEPVRTHVLARERWHAFQEFMIRERGQGPVEGVEFRGVSEATPSPEVVRSIEQAETIVIGPSNPIISIGPILALRGVREAIGEARAPVIAVSPFVGGRVVKGPTDVFMSHAGLPCSAAGAASLYAGLIDALVADEQLAGAEIPLLETHTLMASPEERRRVAGELLEFAGALRR